MFEIGEYIIYSNNGVCRVENIGPMTISGVSNKKMFYTLVPVYTKGIKVFTPTDNEKVIMRRILSKEEAMALIDDIKNIDTLWVADEKRREEIYKESIRKCDCTEWVKIIKTLYLRKRSRIEEGKKVTSGDNKYLQMAEDNLYGELAIPLELNKDKVEEFIISRVKLLDNDIIDGEANE